MFSHIMIGTNDLEKAKVFYDALLGTLDVPPGTYSYELHVSGRLVRTDTITVGAGEAWSLKLRSDDSKSDQIY